MIARFRPFLLTCALLLAGAVEGRAQLPARTTEPFPVFRAMERIAADPAQPKHDRLSSVGGLGRSAHPSVVPALVELLRDPDEEIRRAAAIALGWAGNKAALQPLLARASDPQEAIPVRSAAIEALGVTGDAGAVQAVDLLSRDADPALRREAMLVLIQTPVGAQQDRIATAIRLVEDLEQDGYARAAAAAALAPSGDRRAVEPLIRVLQDPRRPKGFDELPSPEAQTGQAKTLAERLRSLNNVRAHAAAALAQLGDPRAVPALVSVVSDPDPFVRAQSVAALGQFKLHGAVADVSQALRDSDTRVRQAAVATLARNGDPTAAPALRAALADDDATVRSQAALTLGSFRDQAAREAIAKMAEEDSIPQVREAARNALRRLERTSPPRP